MDQVDMKHRLNTGAEEDVIPNGIDLTAYHTSVEWDLMDVYAKKTIYKYPCCDEPYPDVTFHITVSAVYISNIQFIVVVVITVGSK